MKTPLEHSEDLAVDDQAHQEAFLDSLNKQLEAQPPVASPSNEKAKD
jgi:hypothetical protein